MTVELFNVEKARQVIADRGLRIEWVVKQMELSRTAGHAMLRDGLLPKDPDRKKEVLRKLSKLLGVPAKDLVVTLQAKTA